MQSIYHLFPVVWGWILSIFLKLENLHLIKLDKDNHMNMYKKMKKYMHTAFVLHGHNKRKWFSV